MGAQLFYIAEHLIIVLHMLIVVILK